MVMEFPAVTSETQAQGERQSVKSHLLVSRELLVESLYNLAPLLDRALAAGLLSQENYFVVTAERTPHARARRLLEVVHSEMDEAGARGFLECLRGCKKHYPRLRVWLSTDMEIQRGPTERHLQSQLSVLCSRLGYSVLPVSLALFSTETLTQFEFDQVQAATTSYQQTQQLLSICLSKGDRACCSFYQALSLEDPHLASEINVSGLAEGMSAVSVVSGHDPSTHVAVEETRDEGGLDHTHTGVLKQVLTQLDVAPGAGARLNVCELGVAVGLPRWTVRECLLEEAGLGDIVQLRALVTLFLNKTQDAPRLLTRVAECTAQRVLLSKRGCLLLKLLQEAEALLHTGDHLRAEDHRDRIWPIFSFLLCDCMAEALEDPGAVAESWGDPRGAVQLLQGSERVEADLVQELHELWREGGTDSLLQSVSVLAQVLRDLHPLQDILWLSPPAEGAVYSCRPRRLHRVTCFQGLPARVIRKALGPGAPPVSISTDSAPPLHSQYREVCLCLARLLDRVQPQGVSTDLSQAPIATITQHIQSTLSRPAFSPQAFDAGVRHRVLSVLEFDPVQLGLATLQELHRDTLSGLEGYLRPGEHHAFQLVPETVRILGRAELRRAGQVRGPVAIDNGIEEVLRFVTSEPATFLVCVYCRGYDSRGRYFEVREPHCVCVSGLKEEGVEEIQGMEVTVLAVEGGTVWVRERRQGMGVELGLISQGHSGQSHDDSCCFKVTSSRSECEVKFFYMSGRISAVAERDCSVL